MVSSENDQISFRCVRKNGHSLDRYGNKTKSNLYLQSFPNKFLEFFKKKHLQLYLHFTQTIPLRDQITQIGKREGARMDYFAGCILQVRGPILLKESQIVVNHGSQIFYYYQKKIQVLTLTYMKQKMVIMVHWLMDLGMV